MERRVTVATHLKMARQCRATLSCNFNNKQISGLQVTPVSLKSFRNQAFMFFHSIFYEFQMKINDALATPLKMTRRWCGHRQIAVVNLTRGIWWSWKQSKSGNL